MNFCTAFARCFLFAETLQGVAECPLLFSRERREGEREYKNTVADNRQVTMRIN